MYTRFSLLRERISPLWFSRFELNCSVAELDEASTIVSFGHTDSR